MNTAALPAQSGGWRWINIFTLERKYQPAPIRQQQENMSLSVSQNKSGLGTGQRWGAGEWQPRAERRRSLGPGGGQGEPRGGGEGGLCQFHRLEGFLHHSRPLLSPPVTACHQGAGSGPEEGRKLPSVMRLCNLTRQAQLHVLSEDTPPSH